MSTLPLYWKLSSSLKDERLSASATLVSALEDFQAQYTPPSDETDDDEDEEEDPNTLARMDALNAEDVRYALRRLVRGLASSRESSRLGFVVALTELISRLETVTAGQMITLVLESFQINSSIKGQEARDMLFARLFGMTAIVESGLLYRATPLASTTIPASSLKDFRSVFTELVDLGEKKSWLKESAWWSIFLALERLQDSAVEWKQDAIEWSMSLIFKDPKDWTPEKLGAVLKLKPIFPTLDWKKMITPTFKDGNVLAPGTLTTVARIMRDATVEDDDEAIQKKNSGTFKPQLHFVWDTILDQYLSPNAALPQPTIQDFFKIVVDESLFSASSSPERKYWGFQVFERILPRASVNDIPLLFTKNFMRTWINHLSREDRYLHKAAKQVAMEIQKVVAANPNTGMILVLQLLGENGNRQFDKITRTKTVESVLASMTVEGVQQYIDYLIRTAYDSEVSETAGTDGTDAQRTWVADQLLVLVRNGSVPRSDDWITQALELLALHGFFAVKKKSSGSEIHLLRTVPKVPFSEASHQAFRERFFAAIAHLQSQVTSIRCEDKTTRSLGTASDGQPWVSKFARTMRLFEKDTKHIASLRETSEEDVALRKRSRRVVDQLSSVSSDRESTAKGIEVLLNSLYLQTFDDSYEDLYIYEQCIRSAERLFSLEGKKSAKNKERAQSEDDTFEPIDIVVDILIGYLETSTPFTKATANLVFALVSSELKASSIDLLTKQLIIRDPTANALENDEEDDEDDEDEESEDGRNSNASLETSSESADAGDDNAQISSAESDVDEELRSRIAQALQIEDERASEKDHDDGGSEEQSEDEEMMDDDQMLALDDKLAEIFKSSQKVTKKDRLGAQREATNFIIRVLDLVETLLKQQPPNKFIALLIPPLVDLSSATGASEKQLSSKATTILRSRIAKLKAIPEGIDIPTTVAALTMIHETARSAPSPELVQTTGVASLYLARMLLQAGEADAVVKVYRASIDDYFTKRSSKLKVDFLLGFIRRYPGTAWSLRDRLIEYCGVGKSVYVFRQVQCFNLVEVMLTQCVPLLDLRPKMVKFISKCRQVATDVLAHAVQEKGANAANAAQMKELLKFTTFAVRLTQRIVDSPEDISKVWPIANYQKLEQDIEESEAFGKSAPVKSLCKQLVATISRATLAKQEKQVGSQPKKRKAGEEERKSEEEHREEEVVSKKKRRKTKKTVDS